MTVRSLVLAAAGCLVVSGLGAGELSGQDGGDAPARLVVVRSGAPEEVELRRLGRRSLTGAALDRERVLWRGREGDPDDWQRLFGDVLGRGYLGVDAIALTPDLRRHFGAPPGRGVMLSELAPGGPAERAGARVGDVLLAIGSTEVGHPDGLRVAIRALEVDRPVTLQVRRDGRPLELVATPERRERPVVIVGRDLAFGGDPATLLRVAPATAERPAPGALRAAAERLVEQLATEMSGESWQRLMERLEHADLEQIERRMRRVEEQMRTIERRLERDVRARAGAMPPE